jgi:hypothetical protein
MKKRNPRAESDEQTDSTEVLRESIQELEEIQNLETKPKSVKGPKKSREGESQGKSKVGKPRKARARAASKTRE